MGRFRRRLAALLIAATAALCGLSAPAAARQSLPTFRDGNGLHILSQGWLNPRLAQLRVRTAALPQPLAIRILVPAGYAQHRRRRYPVLYLLDGTSGHAADWTTMGNAEQTTAGLPLIVVMPDITMNGDGGGWCTNWPNGTERWETFHTQQLIPWVDHSLRTKARRGQRAIAGLSQGGFCSMSYAARHPDLFSIALAYSGAPDIYYDPDARTGAAAVINGTEVGLDHVPPYSMFGDLAADGINWAAHDPATLAPNLRWSSLFMYFGNGLPGPFDSPGTYSEGLIEGGIYRDNVDFHNRLVSLGIPSVFGPYGDGTHVWPYWARDLQWSIGSVMEDFAHPVSAPRAVTYTSADDSYAVYGWRVTTHRAAREFSTLVDAAQGGFTLQGSGSATVVTPTFFRPRHRYRVVMTGAKIRRRSFIVVAARSHRLRLRVPLGPSNPHQEYTPQAQVAGESVYTTRVSITASARRLRAASI
jgi:S-formylglutathione hydrolase FrmB